MVSGRKQFKTPAGESRCGANLCDATGNYTSWSDLGSPGAVMTFNEAIQGCCNDCYFIAALSSVAWAVPSELDPWGTYYFNGQKVTLNHQEVPVNAGKPVYAQQPSSGDIWAMLYEVAYAKWRSGNTNDKPNIAGTIGNGGSGFDALKEITGYQYPANAEDPSGQTTATIWGNILTGSVVKRSYGGVTYDTYKTKYPSFAETKDNLAQITGIYKSHTYSLFGKIQDGNTKKQYIVLRNPYANLKPEPTGDIIKPAISFFGINLSATNDGVFALEISKFKDYFAKYGSVKNVSG